MIAELWQDFLQYIEAGGFVMPPLLAATVVLWYAIGYRFVATRRGTQRSVRVLLRRLDKGQPPSGDGVIVRAARKAREVIKTPRPDQRRHLDDALWKEAHDIKRFRTLITAIVVAAPLLGLLGTVTGMIETFDSLADMSLFAQSGGIAGGISQALFTTQMGLAVAIPGVIVNGILNRREGQIETEITQIKDILLAGQA